MKTMSIAILILCFSMMSCTKETITQLAPNEAVKTNNTTPEQNAEGTVNGGGGKGVMCTQGGVTTVEVLDLYEARVLYGLTSNYNPQDETEATNLFSDVVPPHFWNSEKGSLADFKISQTYYMTTTIKFNMHFINSGKKLKLTADSFEPLIENNCEMVQIANFYDESILIVDESLWNQMNWLNKIALLTHEYIYFHDRAFGSTNSMATRKLVGQLFSTTGAIPRFLDVPLDKNEYATCMLWNENAISVGYFYAYNQKKTTSDIFNPIPLEVEGIEFEFEYLLNTTTLFRTSTFIPDIKMDQFFQTGFINGSMSVLEIDSYQMSTLSLAINYEGEGRGKISISDLKTGLSIGKLSMSCNKN